MTAEKADRVVTAIEGTWPIPQIADPAWEGEPEDAPQVDEFTSLEWVKIKSIGYLAKVTHRWESKQAKAAAAVPFDDDIAT
jgi:hypothetical protein